MADACHILQLPVEILALIATSDPRVWNKLARTTSYIQKIISAAEVQAKFKGYITSICPLVGTQISTVPSVGGLMHTPYGWTHQEDTMSISFTSNYGDLRVYDDKPSIIVQAMLSPHVVARYVAYIDRGALIEVGARPAIFYSCVYDKSIMFACEIYAFSGHEPLIVAILDSDEYTCHIGAKIITRQVYTSRKGQLSDGHNSISDAIRALQMRPRDQHPQPMRKHQRDDILKSVHKFMSNVNSIAARGIYDSIRKAYYN